MARLPRLTVPHCPHHVIQRGNNRQVIFQDAQDFERMLDTVKEYAQKFSVAVHAYVLMPNHFHMLVTPTTGNGLALMMQAVGRSYVRLFNQRHARTGTLWEGRYRSTLIEAERYLLACMVYIDLNPERAHLVQNLTDWPWSSCAFHLGLHSDGLLTPHALYLALGNTPFSREAAYRQMLQTGLDRDQTNALTEATLRGWALGGEKFVADLHSKTARRAVKASAGRPRIDREIKEV